MVVEERTDDLESRISRLEGIVEQINLRLEDINTRMTSLETRMNVQIVLTFGVWATVVGTLLAMLIRG